MGFEASGERILCYDGKPTVMAMPRRAMKDLGFQACCLRCDASNTVGTDRCRGCINHHQKVREEIARAPQDDLLYQFARELMAMAANPHRYDHDECHGRVLREQQRLAHSMAEAKPLPTGEDIAELFAVQAAAKKENVIPTDLPSLEVLNIMANTLEINEKEYGARTIPSKNIPSVDRSDRLGEDRKMIDKIAGEEAAATAPGVLKEVVEIATKEERVRKRGEWDETLSKVSELLDDDLDL